MSTTVPSYYAAPIRPSHPDLYQNTNPTVNIVGNSATFTTVNVGTGAYISSTGSYFNDVDILTANMQTVTITDMTVDSITVPDLVQQKTMNGLTYNPTSGQVGYFPYNLTPPGVIVPFAGTGAPNGWLLCDGREVSRSVYLDLFNTIGVLYGVGNGVSSFNLPNFKGRIPVGYDATQSYFNTVGKTGGYNTHTLTISEMPAHLHTGTTATGGDHNHSYTASNNSNQNVGYPAGGGSPDVNQGVFGATTSTAGAHVHNFTSTNTGGGLPHNNLQPYVVIQYIIKV